jgi:cell surface protein SprA
MRIRYGILRLALLILYQEISFRTSLSEHHYQEAFAPLVGIVYNTTGQLNTRFEYKKSRQLSLSLVDYQLSEVNSTEWTFGASWRKRGFTLPFKLRDENKKLENDVKFPP